MIESIFYLVYDDNCHMCRGAILTSALRVVLDMDDENQPLRVFHVACFEAYMIAHYGAGWMTRKAAQWVLQVYAPQCWWFKLLEAPGVRGLISEAESRGAN
jgi:hypothetical protein